MTIVAPADVDELSGGKQAAAEVAAALATVGHAIFALMQPGALEDVRPLGTQANRPAAASPVAATRPHPQPSASPVSEMPPAPASQPGATAGAAPATDSPATDEPATDEPATDEPAADSPAARPARGRSAMSMLNEVGFLDD